MTSTTSMAAIPARPSSCITVTGGPCLPSHDANPTRSLRPRATRTDFFSLRSNPYLELDCRLKSPRGHHDGRLVQMALVPLAPSSSSSLLSSSLSIPEFTTSSRSSCSFSSTSSLCSLDRYTWHSPSRKIATSLQSNGPDLAEVETALGEGNGAVARPLVGEDAAVFDPSQQKLTSWVYFTGVLGTVMGVLYFSWLDPNGLGWGAKYVEFFEGISDSREIQMVLMLLFFALVHSGGAALRGRAEEVVGERAYRVLFAGLSLPLAVSAVVFFINHRYDGDQLWQLRTVPGMHELVWVASFVSFFFLYPSTFNLLEVAAVDKPKFHMWETGIMRITRHPQMTGQLIWCIAHTAWIGNSFTLVTSLALCAHHAFGVWHGDQRLKARYGEAFEEVKSRTSIVPFAAIMDGRQRLPPDFYKEFLRAPYFAIVAMTVGAYFCHPLMQQASFWLHW